jgi:hypothetical protein
MFASLDLQQVLRQQEALRREAAQRRLTDRINQRAKSTDRKRSVFGLRPSVA